MSARWFIMNASSTLAGGLLDRRTLDTGNCSPMTPIFTPPRDRRRHLPVAAEDIGRDDRVTRVSCDFPAPLLVVRGKRCRAISLRR